MQWPPDSRRRVSGCRGGALAQQGGIQVEFSQMNRIPEVDLASQRAVVQRGVVNEQLSRAVAPAGLH
ncbi:MAG TPA: FAD-binding protein [Candidatus Acidoferrales bacterium]|nr:FAD-binding protein [Candidatus Acidoferrales bacterium]